MPSDAGCAHQLSAEALEHQTRVPEDIVVAEAGGRSRQALLDALRRQAEWLWLLDGSVHPEPQSLERLLAVLDDLDGLPRPALLASKVVRAGGELDLRSAPVPEIGRRALVVAAVGRGLLAIRVAARGSLLVHRGAFEKSGLPRTTPALYDDRRWTARLLKDELGLLVPRSVVVRAELGEATESRRGRLELVSGIGLVLGGGVAPKETPWFAFRLAEQALAMARGRAGPISRGAAAAAHRATRAGRRGHSRPPGA